MEHKVKEEKRPQRNVIVNKGGDTGRIIQAMDSSEILYIILNERRRPYAFIFEIAAVLL